MIHRQYLREQICPGSGSVGRAVASHTQGSNPDIVEFLSEHLSTLSCIKNTKIKKKEAENGPLLTIGSDRALTYLGRQCTQLGPC